MACPLAFERVWVDKCQYNDAEKKHYEQLSGVSTIFGRANKSISSILVFALKVNKQCIVVYTEKMMGVAVILKGRKFWSRGENRFEDCFSCR